MSLYCSPSSCGSHNAGSMPPTAADDSASPADDKLTGPEETYASPASRSRPNSFLFAFPNRPTTFTHRLCHSNHELKSISNTKFIQFAITLNRWRHQPAYHTQPCCQLLLSAQCCHCGQMPAIQPVSSWFLTVNTCLLTAEWQNGVQVTKTFTPVHVYPHISALTVNNNSIILVMHTILALKWWIEVRMHIIQV